MDTDRNTDIERDLPDDDGDSAEDVEGEDLEDDISDVEAGAEEEAKADAGLEPSEGTLLSAQAFRAAEGGR